MSHMRRLLRKAAHTRLGADLRRRFKRPLGWLRDRGRPASLSPEDVLARTEEFNRNAERHWQTIAEDPGGRAHVLNKPLSTVTDTASIFYRLGIVLDALEPGLGQTILDFGAGSCWLSSYLNRLRCRTVSVDVSPTALKLGEELFRLDPRHHFELEPRFLPYDGHRLPLEDASVDRIVCFDAFHHVPNQDEALAELCRVLKPGGRAVLAEPGEGHGHAGQSVFESERSGVLENELDLADLVGKARAAGFARVLMKPYPDPGAYTLTAEEYLRLMDGAEHLYPLHILRDHLRHFFLLMLFKSGQERRDTRNPGSLLARIQPLPPRVHGHAREDVHIRARIKNVGDTLWLHQADPAGGQVTLVGHLLDGERRPVVRGFVTSELPRDVGPGETVSVDLRATLPREAGRYVLRLDLVGTFVGWFQQFGSQPADLEVEVEACADSRRPSVLKAEIGILAAPPRTPVKPASPLTISLRILNAGDTIWLDAPPGSAGRVCLGAHLLGEGGETVAWDHFRTGLGRTLWPGEFADITCSVPAPPEAGRHRLVLDLLAEQVTWFQPVGSVPVVIPVETTDETPDSASPGVLEARIEVAGHDRGLEAAASAVLTLAVRVTNTGNTLWLHAPREAGGHVMLGGHLRDAGGALVEQDLFRAPLPRDVAPGETVEVPCSFAAPAVPGSYRVELDLVDEGIAWFGTRGSSALPITLRSM